jgi:hypothetical protein
MRTVQLGDYGGCGSAGYYAEVLVDVGLEDGGGSGLAKDGGKLLAELAIDAAHLGDGGLAAVADEGVAEFAEDSGDGVGVNVRVSAIEVAEGFGETMRDGLHDKPGLMGHAELGDGDGEAELKGHVEAGSARTSGAELDLGKIVNGIAAALDEGEDAVQTAAAAGDFESDAGNHAKGVDGGEVGEEKIFVRTIVGKVEKDFSASAWLWHATPSFGKRCETWCEIW